MYRLKGVLAQLALGGLPPRALNVGCGDFPSARVLRSALPGWALYGVDQNGAALRRARQRDPALRLLQADAAHLPMILRVSFGLILVRHPDVFRHRAAWEQIIPALPPQLAPGGWLVITMYAASEVELALDHDLRPATYHPLDERGLPRVDLAGHDRYVRVFRRDGAG